MRKLCIVVLSCLLVFSISVPSVMAGSVDVPAAEPVIAAGPAAGAAGVAGAAGAAGGLSPAMIGLIGAAVITVGVVAVSASTSSNPTAHAHGHGH